MKASTGLHRFWFLMLMISKSFLLGKEQSQDCKSSPDSVNILILHTHTHTIFLGIYVNRQFAVGFDVIA